MECYGCSEGREFISYDQFIRKQIDVGKICNQLINEEGIPKKELEDFVMSLQSRPIPGSRSDKIWEAFGAGLAYIAFGTLGYAFLEPFVGEDIKGKLLQFGLPFLLTTAMISLQYQPITDEATGEYALHSTNRPSQDYRLLRALNREYPKEVKSVLEEI